MPTVIGSIMHKTVRDFVHSMKTTYPDAFKGGRVVEFGSRDINGSVREFFEADEYIGVDAEVGEGVEVRSLCHEYKGKDLSFDMVISTEMLEHDPYWDLSIDRMVRLVKKDGSLLITCAGRHRHPHGHKTYTPIEKYYRNLSARDVAKGIFNKGRFKRFLLDNHGDTDLLTFCYWRY